MSECDPEFQRRLDAAFKRSALGDEASEYHESIAFADEVIERAARRS